MYLTVAGLQHWILLFDLDEWTLISGIQEDHSEHNQEETRCDCCAQLPNFWVSASIEEVGVLVVAVPKTNTWNATEWACKGHTFYRTSNVFSVKYIVGNWCWSVKGVFWMYKIIWCRLWWYEESFGAIVIKFSLNSEAQHVLLLQSMWTAILHDILE